jgi:hypothetical protein
MNDGSFEQRLSEALAVPMSSVQRTALDDRMQELLAKPSPRTVRRLPVRRSLLLAAVLLLLLPTVFAVGAAILSTEDPFGLAEAPEARAELEAAKAQVPLPAGRNWPAYLKIDQSAAYSRGGQRAWVEIVAVCIWFDEWVDARDASNAQRETIAAETIAAIPTWPSWRSPFWTDSVLDHLRPLITAVRDGREQPIRQEIKLNCLI